MKRLLFRMGKGSVFARGATALPEPAPGNGKGVVLRFLGSICDLLGDSCGRPELPRRDADEPLEVRGELALVREAGVCGDVRQGQVAAALQELLGPLDAAGEDVLVGGSPVAALNWRAKW